jgi:hypothetical protein
MINSFYLDAVSCVRFTYRHGESILRDVSGAKGTEKEERISSCEKSMRTSVYHK